MIKKNIFASTFVWILLTLVIFAFTFSMCSQEDSNITDVNWDVKSLDESTDEIKKFTSTAELTEFLKENVQSSNFGLGRTEVDFLDAGVAMVKSAVVESADSGGTSESAQDFSKTNVQVAGVDEADFVKNDGEYIYILSQGNLVIAKGFPASNAEIVSTTNISGNPKDLFINKDRLVVFSQNYEKVYDIAEFDYKPQENRESQTIAYVYDVSDKDEPKFLKEYSVTGNYFQSRMIGDYVYFIAKESVFYGGGPVSIPGVRQNKVLINKHDVFYFDNPEDSYVFHTVAAFNIFEDRERFNSKTFLLGHSNNLYVSEKGIYISYEKNFPYSYYQYQKVDMFFKVIVPLFPEDIIADIREVEVDLHVNSMQSYTESWDKISLILENMYNYMKEEEKDELVATIEKTVSEYEARVEDERSRTIIHKLGIVRDEIEYLSRGEVKGTLLNQFSLDEKDDNLRVATTTRYFTKESGAVTYNNVFVLDREMETIGEIEKIAPDERIYSTRFIGDKLYMVTFKQTDPLFTVDLSDPTNPQILGQLKVPGFSSYLHPYGDTHLIGVGKDTKELDGGRVETLGVKLSLFDVSDFKNPIEVDTIVIGDSGSYSNVLSDHKAFLFDKEKNLLVLPIREVSGRYETDSKGFFRVDVWNGAYVFTITSNGFKVRGKVSHSIDDEEYSYWSSPYNVKRALYMDDNLYTISDKKIEISDLGTVEEIGVIDLPYDDSWYPYKEDYVLR